MYDASGDLEGLLGSPLSLCCLPPRGIVHYCTLKYEGPSPYSPSTMSLSVEGVYEMFGE